VITASSDSMPSTRCWYFMNPSGGYACRGQGSSCLPALRTSIEQGAVPYLGDKLVPLCPLALVQLVQKENFGWDILNP